MRDHGAAGAAERELGAGERVGEAKLRERGTGGADKNPLRHRATHDEAGDEGIVACAGNGAGGEVDELLREGIARELIHLKQHRAAGGGGGADDGGVGTRLQTGKNNGVGAAGGKGEGTRARGGGGDVGRGGAGAPAGVGGDHRRAAVELEAGRGQRGRHPKVAQARADRADQNGLGLRAGDHKAHDHHLRTGAGAGAGGETDEALVGERRGIAAKTAVGYHGAAAIGDRGAERFGRAGDGARDDLLRGGGDDETAGGIHRAGAGINRGARLGEHKGLAGGAQDGEDLRGAARSTRLIEARAAYAGATGRAAGAHPDGAGGRGAGEDTVGGNGAPENEVVDRGGNGRRARRGRGRAADRGDREAKDAVVIHRDVATDVASACAGRVADEGTRVLVVDEEGEGAAVAERAEVNAGEATASDRPGGTDFTRRVGCDKGPVHADRT